MATLGEAVADVQNNVESLREGIGQLHEKVDEIGTTVGEVEGNVQLIQSDVQKLTDQFNQFVMVQIRANRLGQAETRLVKIRQEIDKKYGHYDIVRRTTTGILQATDLNIIRKETISHATEELMISTPDYWLAPCLVALSAWINDKKDLAARAVKEAMKRNDEKTALFFALVCRRAGRKAAALKWVEHYLSRQNPEALDRETILLLDAYACGLFGIDSQGMISRQTQEWLDTLSARVGFTEQQTAQWSEAINMKRPHLSGKEYPYLRKYSRTWPVLKDVLESAALHHVLFDYLTDIFEQPLQTGPLTAQLDMALTDLVSNYDAEELPLREKEKLEQFVVDFKGDEEEAQRHMQVERTAFAIHRDFTQLLTDAAMKPESSHASPSTQKYAIAMSKEWILDAYNDIIAANRIKVPHEIQINVDSYKGVTTDGQNEQELLAAFSQLVDREKKVALDALVFTDFARYCFPGGLGIAGIGLVLAFTGSPWLGAVIVIVGILAALYSKGQEEEINTKRQAAEVQFNKKKVEGVKVIRAMIAEIVDYRAEFVKKDKESENVIDFLNQIKPDQYVQNQDYESRLIKGLC